MPSILDGLSGVTPSSGFTLGGYEHPDFPEIASSKEPKMRDFGDADSVRQRIFTNVLNAAKNIQPVHNIRHTLELRNVHYADKEDFPIKKQKHAILHGDSLFHRLRGTWVLKDAKTGQVLDEQTSTVAQVPYMTDRGTFVVNGNEYSLSNQMRLRAGIFTRIKENGEIESHVNILPGKGLSHKYFLDPVSGIFKINVKQSKIPLLPVLRALGAKDNELRQAWGDELFAANQGKDDTTVIPKLFQRFVRHSTAATPEDKQKALVEAIEKMELDPEVTKRTLGKPFTHLSKDAIIETTKKLLAVSRGESDPDDRDALAYQVLMGPEDLFAERIGKDRSLLRQALWRAFTKNNIQHIQPGMFSKVLNHVLMNSGLGQPLEEINPSDIFDQQNRVSRLGEGGMPSIDAVPDESRSVQPSHFGFIDPIRTPESFRVGIDSRIAYSAKKGDDGRLYAPFIDAKTNKTVFKTPQDVADLTLAFPGELRKNKPMVAAMVGSKTKFVPREQVNYELPAMENAFSPLANMIPGKSAVKGQRVAMGSRFLAQALPVVDAESPYVQSAMPGGKQSFEEFYSKWMGAVRADAGGKVIKKTPDEIIVQQADGVKKTYDLYNTFPYNRKTFLHNTAAVDVGDTIKPGQLLAKSNYTDNQGVTALGKNARVAYMPFRGLNYEDAYVISKSFANRMSSEHMYQHEHEWLPSMKKGKKTYVSLFPTKFNKQILDKVDDDGVAHPGQIIHYGEPLILNVQEKEPSFSQVHKGRGPSYSDKSILWDHHSDGIVTDVAKTRKGVTISVRTYSPMQVGDKLSGRYGDKGVLADVIPDEEMPHDQQGRPFEILANPLGIISRTNPAQMVEAALGKISERTGQPYKIEDFNNIPDLTQFAIDELAKHNIPDQETVIDPKTGRQIPAVFTGNRFFMKLHHTSESKGQGRGTAAYTAEQTPAKGGVEGSKMVSLMDMNALLSHGATEVIRDANAVRGQRNDQYWQMFMSGFRPPEPQIPFVYRKFIQSLRAAGINPVRKGGQLHIMALTNRDIDRLAEHRYLQNADTVDWKAGLRPIKGGLFDPQLTGGHSNENRWAAIKLAEPFPNPVFEEPIRRLLGLTQAQYEDVLSGRKGLAHDGSLYDPQKMPAIFGHGTGTHAIQRALADINLDRAIEMARAQIKGGKKTQRDIAVRKLGYLIAAKKLNIHPKEWMLDQVPVIPPAFRPVSVLSTTKAQMIADPNFLYKEVFDANKNLADMKQHVSDVSEERLALYNAFKGVTGLGDPIHPKNQEKRIQGVLRHIFGNSPKLGAVQRKLLSSAVDLVGRAVITPNPDLDMDHVGLPENRAWTVYTPFIVRRLVRRGMPRLQAARAVLDRTSIAREALLQEMEDRPVIINRAPVLHRYGIMAAWPILTKGDVLQLSPIVTKGFGADFDGDAMQYHVPATDEAKEEAVVKMLPSRNLLAVSTFKPHLLPTMEYIGGLYRASAMKNEKLRPRIFESAQAAIAAFERDEISVDQPVEILKH